MKAWRHYFLVFLLLGGSVAVALRVAWLSFLEKDFLQHKGDELSLRAEDIPAYRGIISDRFGEPLAVSTPVFAAWTDPSRHRISRADLERLAPFLNEDAERLDDLIEKKRRDKQKFVYLKRRLDRSLVRRIKDLGIKGLEFREEYRRYYPKGETTAHIVGLTNIDDHGIEGIEKSFDNPLRGKHGSKLILVRPKNRVIRVLKIQSTPQMGKDLALSIDMRLQYFAHRKLKNTVRARGAKSGSVVMLDVRTGEILALVNQPSYNPNERPLGKSVGMRNQAVIDAYEPGSTIKPFTVIAALESGDYRPDTIIDTSPGRFRIADKLIEDPLNYGAITLAKALHKSSQVGFAKLALELPPGAVYEVLRRAGAGDFVGSGLHGEGMGRFNPTGLRHPVGQAALAYGYGLSLTPLQLAQAYLTLASGGVRMQVTAFLPDKPPDRRRVFEEHIARRVLGLMEGVTSPDGTAPTARVPGYRVAGKTGTTRIVDAGGYSDQRHVALFVGVAPLSEPRILVVVVVNEAQGDRVSGGSVAAPVFAEVAKQALRVMGVPPDGEQLAAAFPAEGRT